MYYTDIAWQKPHYWNFQVVFTPNSTSNPKTHTCLEKNPTFQL